MKNVFVEISYTKCDAETIVRPFLKNQNWVYPRMNSLKVLYSLFLLYANLSAIEM